MGNSSSKEKEQRGTTARPGNERHSRSTPGADGRGTPRRQITTVADLAEHVYNQNSRNEAGRGPRYDLSLLTFSRERNEDPQTPERPRETRIEREARRTERERQLRLKERERSLREENVDGGYLVTLGTYTGVEDFSKSVVRQLQIERRLAPFWRGLNDHSDSWTEAQLVAAGRGLPIPAADEVPPHMSREDSQASDGAGRSSSALNGLTVPIMTRSQSAQSDSHLSASHPAFSNSGSASPINASSAAALFRGRAKTLASLASGSKTPDLSPQELQLPRDPNVNGLPVEAYLYREASECPICFMYYPPYLNKTRCCDQSICSECFVQIKRPDPHPPEHEQPGQQRPPEEEAGMLVSEVAACPFCVTPEFGVSYEPPPFRRGLTYANQGNGSLNGLKNSATAMSSSSSLTSADNRRRATSLSATAPQVITTDKVRPDWAKKLADARSHALRRSVAATALHNAAYVLGNNGEGQSRSTGGFGRRRRTLLTDSPGESGSGTPRIPEDGSSDGQTVRAGGRRNRVDDIEELMMMEAIRLSLAAEEDRKKKTEKDARKDLKKREKEAKKEAKQAEKQAKRRGSAAGGLYNVGTNESASTWASAGMSRSMSNLGTQPSPEHERIQGKGKAPVNFSGLLTPGQTDGASSSSPPTVEASPSLGAMENPQRHLEASRANINPPPSLPISMPGKSSHFRQLSNTSSVASSYIDSAPGSLRAGVDSNTPSASNSRLDVSSTPTPAGGESLFNFRSLAAMVGDEEKKRGEDSDHVEHAPSPDEINASRSRGNTGESSSSVPPPNYSEKEGMKQGDVLQESTEEDQITPAAPVGLVHDVVDSKEHGSVNVFENGGVHEATQ